MDIFLYWRELLIGGLLLALAGLLLYEHHEGYASCETAVKQADAAARADEKIQAITEQDQYQAEAAKIIADEKKRSATLQEKINALKKMPCDSDSVGVDAIKLWNDNRPKTYNSNITGK